MPDESGTAPSTERRPVTIIDATDASDDDTSAAAVDLDTGDADREEVAILAAQARINGANVIRTREPRAARRAVTVIDAILDARDEPRNEA